MSDVSLFGLSVIAWILATGVVDRIHSDEEDPAAAAAHRLGDLRDERGEIAHDGVMKAVRHKARMRREAGRQGLNAAGITPGSWTSLGPGNIGGRVRALAVHPTIPDILWAGSVSGGVWKTTNGGASWAPVDDFMANLAITSIVLPPGNPDVLYAATGEAYGNGDAIRGAGIFKSTDGGTSWARLDSTNNSTFYFVYRLSFSPDGGTLLAATQDGIQRSTDGGASWTRVHPSQVLDLDFHPTDNQRAIASSRGTVLYSTDGGTTWSPGTVPAGGAGRIEVAYAPSQPAITYASADLNAGELWKSTDGGRSYAVVNRDSGYLRGQGYYNNALWVDPTNPAVLLVGGQFPLWRSTNGGATLVDASAGSTHVDHHVMVADPRFDGTTNRTVFLGSDGGVFRAADVYAVGGTTPWQELNNNLGITQFYGGAGNVTSGTVVGGAQDHSNLRYRPPTGTEGWTYLSGGDGGFCAADPTDPAYLYIESQYLNLQRSTDGGQSAHPIHAGITDRICAHFIAPFILDPNDPNRMLAGTCRLWRSNNVKAPVPTWTPIKPPADAITAVAVPLRDPDLIFVAHDSGVFYRTTDGTSESPAWTRLSPAILGRRATRVTIDPYDHDVVYATFGGFSPDNVWRSTDGGASWSDRTGSGATGLPEVPVRSLVVHPAKPSWIYVGTEVGIFASEDAGATWSVPPDGPANVSVDELFWMDQTLVAATHGRGMFQVPIPLAPVVGIGVSGRRGTAAEPGGSVAVTVRLTTSDGQPTGSPATVVYQTADGTATVGADYTAAGGTLSFPAGTVSGATQIVNVTLIDDPAAEGNETFLFALSAPAGVVLASPVTQTVTILDDDAAPTLSVADETVSEGNAATTQLVFRPTLGQAMGRPVTLSYTTVNGTAHAGSDYTATSGTLTFAVGSLTQPLGVEVRGDTVRERDETLRVVFSGEANATATGTILNDDTGPLATSFYTVAPCRAADTRNPPGPAGGPALSGGSLRSFAACGACGVPADALAVAINVTAVGGTAVGNLRLFAAGTPLPNASALNFPAQGARANNAIIPCGTGGQISVQCDLPAPGSVHFLFDVYGYFR